MLAAATDGGRGTAWAWIWTLGIPFEEGGGVFCRLMKSALAGRDYIFVRFA